MSVGTEIGHVWVFDEGALEGALERYQADALAAYPQQEERIRIAVAAIRDFLHSNYAEPLSMKSANR